MNVLVIAAFLDEIDKGDRCFIDVAYHVTKEAGEAALQRAETATFVFGHEGAYIEVDRRKQNEPNKLLKELLK